MMAEALRDAVPPEGEVESNVPTILITGPYRVYFYSGDREEPPHVHVERDRCRAKYWLRPVRLAESRGFGRAELGRIERIVQEQEEHFLGSWNAFFSD